jgi:peptidyl-prolyl cis-trans isomerase D
MLQLFRNFFKSKIGVGLTLAFLALIAFAFASSDVASSGAFGGIAGGDSVAVVGDSRIGNGDFTRSVNLAVDQVRQQDPTISMAAFVERGGLEEVLDQMIDRRSISLYGKEYGLRAGDNLVNSEIQSIPAFRGPDGSFSEAAFRQALAQRQLSESTVRSELADGLMAKQVLVPAAFGAKLPAKIVRRYAALAKERRQGAIATLPSLAYAPKGDPSVSQLASYYQAHKGDFIRPERRVLRYAVFGEEALGDITPTEAEIAARYQRNKAQYAAQDLRTLRQLVVPTRQAAEAIRTSVKGGESLSAAARRAGLEVAEVGPIDRAAYAAQTSTDVAAAVYAAPQGTIAEPARGRLGWYLVQVVSAESKPARSLADVRGEIAAALEQEKRRSALSELAGSVEERFEGGESIAEVAEDLKLELASTKPVMATGQVYGSASETIPPVLGPALASAFEMEEGEPQIAEVEPGKTFVVYEASRITPSAAAPLREIRDDVTVAWRLSEGSKAAKAAADRVLARTDKGRSLAAAHAAEKVRLPQVDSVNLTREQLAATQQVPPPLALLFSMAKGTAKKLEAQGNSGWYVVAVDTIEPGKIGKDDPLLAQASTALSQLAGREYSDQLRVAMREELGVERNADAIAAVRKQLTGAGEN